MRKHNKINTQNLNPLNSFSHARDQLVPIKLKYI